RLLAKIGNRVGPDGIFGRFGCQFYDAHTQAEVRIDAELDNDPEHPHAGGIEFNGWGPRAFELLESLLEVLEKVCLGQPPQVTRSWDVVQVSSPRADEPPLHAVQPAPPPDAKPKVYLSYAWGNNDPHDELGQRRLKVANQIIDQVPGWGYDLRYDKQQTRPGDRISEFMNEISHGDHRVIVVLSAKYLKSIYCMTELMTIYDHSRRDDHEFLRRVRPVVLPDAKIGNTLDRAIYVDFWLEQVQRYEARIEKPGGYKSLGVSGKEELDAMNRWVFDLADRLKSISDVIAPHVKLRELEEAMLQDLKVLLEREPLA
ncbi:MAG: toll/interleukin-1 receptor domain-containing protein, partial [Planctomycetaceae bacterium]|nr:toll/interleukin-1 receptor domain-containing protein [Planctomycetaceae bacterium]